MLNRLLSRLRLRTNGTVTKRDRIVPIRELFEQRRLTGASILCNLGCGTRTHPDWINIDSRGDGSAVFAWDLKDALPIPDHSCDVVYSSHVIEHFDRNTAYNFLIECKRILKHAGIIRLVAPDLEGIARSYIACLENALQMHPSADARYEWSVIELLDQMVRHKSGGEMLKYWSQPIVPAEDFVAARIGTEYWHAREQIGSQAATAHSRSEQDVGKFRLGGEVHQWMYDRYSLGKLLVQCGFKDVHPCQAEESAIEDFAMYRLDTEPDGSIYKPDSFFLEAVAP